MSVAPRRPVLTGALQPGGIRSAVANGSAMWSGC